MAFICSLSERNLCNYVINQLLVFFPDYNQKSVSKSDYYIIFSTVISSVLFRCELCFGSINVNHYHDEKGNTVFSHLHADQYASFLYFLSSEVWNRFQRKDICDKVLYLNRMLNSVFISYKCKLPEHFLLSHPIGSVIGNAEYNDFLVVCQNVTVNTGLEGGVHPKLGKGLFLGAGCSIIGNQRIGNFVSIGANAFVYQCDIPDNSVVKAKNGNLCAIEHRKNHFCKAQRLFNIDFSNDGEV